MQYLNWNQINESLTYHARKFSVYISRELPCDSSTWNFVILRLEELYKNNSDDYNTAIDGIINGGLFFFDSKEGAEIFYEIFAHPYINSDNIYAALYSPIDGLVTENT